MERSVLRDGVAHLGLRIGRPPRSAAATSSVARLLLFLTLPGDRQQTLHALLEGEATLVIRDALGRVNRTTVQIYSDSERLAPGLTETLETPDLLAEESRLLAAFLRQGDRYVGVSVDPILEVEGRFPMARDDVELHGPQAMRRLV